ncbi:ABC transporter ATP-binding protein [Thermodesulfobacteriota bacterium]
MNDSLKLLKRVLHDGREKIPSYILVSAVSLVMVPIELYSLVIMKKLIDGGFMVQDWVNIKGSLAILILLFFTRSIIGYGSGIFSMDLSLRVTQKYQESLFFRLLHMPVSYYFKEPTGQIMSRLLEDGTRFANVFDTLFGRALLSPLRLLALLVFLIYTDPGMTLLMLFSVFLSIIVITWAGKKIRNYSKAIQAKNASIYSFIEQVFPNIQIIKASMTEKETVKSFKTLMDELIDLLVRALKISLVSDPMLQMLKYLAIGSVFIYGGWLISKDMLSFGAFTMFLGASYLFFSDINSIGNSYRSLKESLARLEVLYDIIDHPLEREVIRSGEVKIAEVERLEFKNIFFEYNPSRPVLKDISFEIIKGEFFGITGQSGSGKTTLARLLLRFIEPSSGEIYLNGQSKRNIDIYSIRSSISIVFQENIILNLSISENIAYGCEGASEKEIRTAAKTAGAHSFIMSLPEQYETLVGENGKSLSGGERQRIAIARAVISNPEILILDEGTAFLEVKQEEAILKRIKEARRDKITIIISHRLSALGIADRVLTLDNGNILST